MRDAACPFAASITQCLPRPSVNTELKKQGRKENGHFPLQPSLSASSLHLRTKQRHSSSARSTQRPFPSARAVLLGRCVTCSPRGWSSAGGLRILASSCSGPSLEGPAFGLPVPTQRDRQDGRRHSLPGRPGASGYPGLSISADPAGRVACRSGPRYP